MAQPGRRAGRRIRPAPPGALACWQCPGSAIASVIASLRAAQSSDSPLHPSRRSPLPSGSEGPAGRSVMLAGRFRRVPRRPPPAAARRASVALACRTGSHRDRSARRRGGWRWPAARSRRSPGRDGRVPETGLVIGHDHAGSGRRDVPETIDGDPCPRSERRHRAPGHRSVLPAHPPGRPRDARCRPAAIGWRHIPPHVAGASPLSAPVCRIRLDAHLTGRAGGQDWLIAIFLAGPRFGSGTRISRTPSL